MKREPQFLPLRQAVIYAHTRRMLDSSALCVRKFALRVAEQYMALVAPDLRQAKFRRGVTLDDLCKAEKHNAQILGRYMDGTLKVLPADLEDAWVLALPEPYRGECERDLAARRGRVSFELPDNALGVDAAAMGKLFKQFGELCETLGPALADGVLDADDRPQLPRIVKEANDVIAATLSLKHQAMAALHSERATHG